MIYERAVTIWKIGTRRLDIAEFFSNKTVGDIAALVKLSFKMLLFDETTDYSRNNSFKFSLLLKMSKFTRLPKKDRDRPILLMEDRGG